MCVRVHLTSVLYEVDIIYYTNMPIMHSWWIGIGGNGISIDNHYNCHTKDKLVTKIPACDVSELKICFSCCLLSAREDQAKDG